MMSDKVKLECMVCGKEFLGLKPQICCYAFDCGCRGLPIDPIICSSECWDKGMKITSYNQLRELLKAEKERRGISYSEIADALGYSQSTVEKWFSGANHSTMSFEKLLNVCELFGYDIDVSTDIERWSKALEVDLTGIINKQSPND